MYFCVFPETEERLEESSSSGHCAWCQKLGVKLFLLKTSSGTKAFCSEVCFTQCRRASFKRNKVCDWCKHVRHTVNYVDFQDGDQQLQFCSDKCLNQYKMTIFCKETQEHLRQVQPQSSSTPSADKAEQILITPELWIAREGSLREGEEDTEQKKDNSLDCESHEHEMDTHRHPADVKPSMNGTLSEKMSPVSPSGHTPHHRASHATSHNKVSKIDINKAIKIEPDRGHSQRSSRRDSIPTPLSIVTSPLPMSHTPSSSNPATCSPPLSANSSTGGMGMAAAGSAPVMYQHPLFSQGLSAAQSLHQVWGGGPVPLPPPEASHKSHAHHHHNHHRVPPVDTQSNTQKSPSSTSRPPTYPPEVSPVHPAQVPLLRPGGVPPLMNPNMPGHMIPPPGAGFPYPPFMSMPGGFMPPMGHPLLPPNTLLTPYPVPIPIPIPVPIPIPIPFPRAVFDNLKKKIEDTKPAQGSSNPDIEQKQKRPRVLHPTPEPAITITPSYQERPPSQHSDCNSRQGSESSLLSDTESCKIACACCQTQDDTSPGRRHSAGGSAHSSSSSHHQGTPKTSLHSLARKHNTSSRHHHIRDRPTYRERRLSSTASDVDPEEGVIDLSTDRSKLERSCSASSLDLNRNSYPHAQSPTSPSTHRRSTPSGRNCSDGGSGMAASNMDARYSARRSRILDAPSVPRDKVKSPLPEKRHYFGSVPRDTIYGKRRCIRPRIKSK